MSGEAQMLHDSKLLNEIFDKLEKDAFEVAVSAKFDEDEKRRTSMQEVASIRSVRGKLKALLSAQTKSKPVSVA